MTPLLMALAMMLAANDRYDIRFQTVAPGVHVAYRPEPLRPYVEGNATIIVNEKDVVVVDASGSPRTARKVIEKIRSLTPNPVRYVILTHIHRDHRLGLQEYVAAYPGVEVIAHPLMKEIIDRPGSASFVADTIKRLEKQRSESAAELSAMKDPAVKAFMRRYYDEDLPPMLQEYESIRNLGPTATVADKLVLVRGARTIEILFLGRGDTDHDLVVYLPKEKIVVTGDMVVHPFPYGFSDQPMEWLATLRKLEALDIETLIPGHGAVQTGESYLRRVIALVESVQKQVAAGATVDLTEFERELIGDDPVARHFFQEWFAKPSAERAQRALQKN